MNHFMDLQRTTRKTEMNHKQIQQKLQQRIQQTYQVLEPEQNKEVGQLKRLHS